jgi:hypothetical protein
MKIDRGIFFHSVYRIQQKFGRVFRGLEPYSLFPLDEYFRGSVRKGAESAGCDRDAETAGRASPTQAARPAASTSASTRAATDLPRG